MPIRVQILEDEEIRKQIQEMVQGQYRALVREEVHEFFKAYTEETIRKSTTESKIKGYLEDAAVQIARSSEYWTAKHFDKHLREKMDTVYKNTIEAAIKAVNIVRIVEGIVAAKLTR